ncbi:TorF family putative porin [Pseudomonas sp. PD9R]|uniref:TorF family putative porin n=1 Tax=Pseudomonas sp. PD9R TaxID=2853534 RepID=UPI001C49187D|nr:TorF family putative porin [Pseudomonas sp. PD9R]MBV6823397.1 TorF family putative porin [Pseudomonas sp. PD9R]
MHRHALTLFLGCTFLPMAAHAITLTDDLQLMLKPAVVSDYRSRGLSMTLGDPAAQLDATLIHSSGAYVGVWTSNVDFGMDLKARLEQDFYAGFFKQLTDDVSLDLGYLKYTYAKEAQFNQSEVYAIVKAYGFKVGSYYSNDLQNFVGKDQDTLYTYLGYSYALPTDTGLEVRYGRFDFKDDVFVDGSGNTRGDYHEWEARLTHSALGVDWALSYVDTDLSRQECTSYYGYGDICTATVVVSASKTF